MTGLDGGLRLFDRHPTNGQPPAEDILELPSTSTATWPRGDDHRGPGPSTKTASSSSTAGRVRRRRDRHQNKLHRATRTPHDNWLGPVHSTLLVLLEAQVGGCPPSDLPGLQNGTSQSPARLLPWSATEASPPSDLIERILRRVHFNSLKIFAGEQK